MPDTQFQRLCDILFSDPEKGVERIIHEIIGQENRYVDFKATALKPADLSKIPGEANSKCNQEDDYLWNIMKEIIAFANTSGGIVFVGIAEDEQTHSLLTPDIEYKTSKSECKTVKEREDWDEYKRVVDDKLRKGKFVTTDQKWDKKKDRIVDVNVIFSFEDSFCTKISNLFNIDIFLYKDRFVLGIIVEPGEKNDYIYIKRDNKNGIFVRRSGKACWMDDPLEIRSYARPYSSVPAYTNEPTLHRIPAPSYPFVGRKQELEDLHRLLSPYGKERRRIPVLTGPEGIGKHTLAGKYCELYNIEYSIIINAANLNCAKDIYYALADRPDFLSFLGLSFDGQEKNSIKIEKIKLALFEKTHEHILIFLERIQKPSSIFLDESFPDLFPDSSEDYVHILATSSSNLDWNITENDNAIQIDLKGLTEEEGLELLCHWRPFEKGSAEEKAALDIIRIYKGHPGLLSDAGRRLKKSNPPRDDDYRMLFEKLKNNPHYVQDEIEFDAIRARIHQAVTGDVDGQNQSICSICRPISKSFVGRLEELKKLNELVFKSDENSGNTLKQIPVITGDAGVGKTELAVAYAYVFADMFPQGRFLIPMQGVNNWAEAMTKLVEGCDNCGQDPIDLLGLPENFSKLPLEEKRNTVYRTLSRRARKGALLLLLDNLEDMRLISENDGLRELPGALPMNLHMIATTRLNETSSSSIEMPTLFEINNLKEKDALELFCKICDKVFPFADYPFEDGKLSIDLIPEEKRPGPEKIESIERDYGVLRNIIRLLDRHAWSVEIVAGRIAFKSKRMKIDIQKEWAGLHDNLLGNLTGKTYRSAGNKAENLLQQTFDLILKQDELVEGLGQRIMRLAEIASFFPPDQIPEYALRQIWIEQFGDEEISFEQDGMPLTGNAYEYTVNQLNMFRITGGKEPMFKMHRLTRGVLHNRLTEDEKLEIVRLMRKCLDDYLKNKTNQALQFLQTWCAWCNEWIDALPVLQEDTTFLKTLLDLVKSCLGGEIFLFEIESLDRRKMFAEARELLAHEFLNRIADQEIKARFLFIKGSSCLERRHFNESEKIFKEALAIWHDLACAEPGKYNADIAKTLSSLAYLHRTLDQNKEANDEYNEAYTLYQKLEESNPEKYSLDFAAFLNNYALMNLTKQSFVEAEKGFSEALKIFRKQASDSFGNTCIGTTMANLAVVYTSCCRYKEAEAELKEALSFFHNLMEENPEKYTSYYAHMLIALASLYDDIKRFQEAESKYGEALAIFQKLAEKNPEKYSGDFAELLRRLADYHSDKLHFDEAEKEYRECLEIFRKLMQEKPEVYSYDFAGTLYNRARLHSELGKYEDAENEYSEALPIFRKLAENNPQMHKKTLATFFIGYASFLSERQSEYNEALSKYNEAVSILRGLAGANPTSYNFDLASCLYDTGTIYCRQKNYPVAQSMLSEALAIYRGLATTNPRKYKEQIADSLRHLAEIHCNCGQATSAYSEYKKALSLYRELAVLTPVKHDSSIAKVLREIGEILLSRKQFKEAENNFSEALAIYRNLDEKKPGAFSSDIELCLRRLADYYGLTGHYEKAEAELLEALTICQKFVQDTPELNQSITAIMNSLADLRNKSVNMPMQKKSGKKRK